MLRLPLLHGALAFVARADPLEDRYQAKLAKPFAKNAAWVTDYDAARAAAKKSNRVLFAYFTRSYRP